MVLGEERGDTKTDRARTVRLVDPLARDLNELRLACGRPDASQLLFPRQDGGPWQDHDYRNWRKRRFAPAALAAGVERPRPYELRHSFVSLLIHEGVSVVEVARQAGHSASMCLGPTPMFSTSSTPRNAWLREDQIQQAREQLVSPMCRAPALE